MDNTMLIVTPISACSQGHTGWPLTHLTDVVDIENVTDALNTGPYGKCVYDTDNDVVSHQVSCSLFCSSVFERIYILCKTNDGDEFLCTVRKSP